MSKKMIPNIRFKGFTDDWGTSKLCEIADRITRKNSDNSSNLPLTISAQYGLIPQVDFFNSRIASRDVSNYFLIKRGEFAYNKSTSDGYPFGAIKRLDKYDMGVLSTLYIIFHLRQEFNSDYVVSYYDTYYWNNEVAMVAAEGARNHGLLNISAKDFFETHINLPAKIKEQEIIGRYYITLNNLVNNVSLKLDKLYSLKKTMFVKMFPQGDALVPEIRLKGFKGSWKIVKLGDISKKVTEKNVDREYQITLTNSAEYGVIDQRDFFDREISNEDNINSYYVVKPDDFVYNPRVSTIAPVGPINRNKTGITGIMSPLYYVFRIDDVELLYLEYFFKNFSWHSFMYLNGNNGARSDRFSISDKTFSMMPICIPEDTMEQKAIGKYFQTLDKQLSLYEQKLSKLNNLKTSFLQNMFI